MSLRFEDLPRETRLVLWLARVDPGPDVLSQAQSLVRAGLDWPRLFATAKRQNLLYLVAHNLLAHLRAELPAEALLERAGARISCTQECRQLLSAAAYHAVRRRQRGAAALAVLRAAGAPFLVLKGPHLAEVMFGSYELRPMVDLDVWVPIAHVSEFRARLARAGWQWLDSDTHHGWCTDEQGILPVELHWEISDAGLGARIDSAACYGRGQTAVLLGQEVRVPAAEDLVVYLCHHAVGHHLFETGLRLLADVNQTVTAVGPRLAWETVQLRAREWQVEKQVAAVLWFARAWMQTPAPPFLTDPVAGKSSLAPMQELVLRMLAGNETPPGRVTLNLGRFVHSRGWRARWRVLTERVCPPRGDLEAMYSLPPGRAINGLWYACRIASLLRRHTRALLGYFLSGGAPRADALSENKLRYWLRDAGE